MAGVPSIPTNIFELALRRPSLRGSDAQLLASLFDIRSGQAPCRLSSKLGAKYGTIAKLDGMMFMAVSLTSFRMLRGHACGGEGLSLDNQQQVVSVTDRVLGGQVWYNVERSRKPQTFTQVRTHRHHRGSCRHWQCHWILVNIKLSSAHARQSPSKTQRMEAGPVTSASGTP